MAGKVIGKHLNLGYAGRISRDADVLVENRMVKETSAEIPFGTPVILNTDNTYSHFGASGTDALFAGIAVAAVKQATNYYSNEVVYKPLERCDVLVRGTATVVCENGTPTAGGAVYVMVIEDAVGLPNAKIGDFFAEEYKFTPQGGSETTATVKLTGIVWTTGYLDANKVAEVTMTTRVNA